MDVKKNSNLFNSFRFIKARVIKLLGTYRKVVKIQSKHYVGICIFSLNIFWDMKSYRKYILLRMRKKTCFIILQFFFSWNTVEYLVTVTNHFQHFEIKDENQSYFFFLLTCWCSPKFTVFLNFVLKSEFNRFYREKCHRTYFQVFS